MPAQIREPVRLSINLSADVAEALRSLAQQKGTTITEVVRDAISTEKFLYEEQQKNAQILVKEPDGTLKQLILR